MLTIYINRGPLGYGGYTIDGLGWSFRIYMDCSKREAVRRYREEYGLKHKKLRIVDCTK